MTKTIRISKRAYGSLVSGANGNFLKGDAATIAALVAQDLAGYSPEPYGNRRVAYLTYLGRAMLSDGELDANGGLVLKLLTDD